MTSTGNYSISKSLTISNFPSMMQRKRFDYSLGLEALPLLQAGDILVQVSPHAFGPCRF